MLVSTEEKHLLVKSSLIFAFIYCWWEAITVVQVTDSGDMGGLWQGNSGDGEK